MADSPHSVVAGADPAIALAAELVGREGEIARLRSLIADARAGTSGVLVVTGPPGIGKTSLLRAAFRDPPGVGVIVVDGVEPEASLAYGALHRLLAPLLPPRQPLPEPLQQALDSVFGRRTGEPPDPFLVGLAALTVLTGAARPRPLVCVLDDVQWIDRASLLVLAFVARRLLADPLVLVFAARPDPDATTLLAGLPFTALDALDHDAQLALLHRRAPTIRPAVAARIAGESAGNPLALVEYARNLSPGELSGEEPLAEGVPLPAHIEHLFDRDIRALPEDVRLLLTIAAVEPAADAELVARSATAFGVDLAHDPERHLRRLATIRPHVSFGHPLVRSAAYRIATPRERRRIHAALADAHADGDPLRRAWHLARAADGADDDIADELDRTAVVARTRSSYAAESELLQHAADLTRDARRRDDRLRRSGAAAVSAGQLARALALVPDGDAGGDRVGAAKAALVRAQATLGLAHFREAPMEFAATARRLRGHDEARARDAWHLALHAALTADGIAEPRFLDVIAGQAAAAGLAPGPARTFIELVAVGLVRLRTGDRQGGVAVLREAFENGRVEQPQTALGIEAALGTVAAMETFDVAGAQRLLERLLERDRRAGVVPGLRVTTVSLAFTAVCAGRLGDAQRLMSDSVDLQRASNADHRWDMPVLHVPARSGRDGEFDEAYERVVPAAQQAGFGSVIVAARVARGELLVSRRRYTDAVDELREAFGADPIGYGTLLLPTLIEAAARSDDEPLARRALERLEVRAAAAATPWARGLLAGSRAIVALDSDAEVFHQRALAWLQEAEMPFDAARARLLYGEWLRRHKRRTEAVEQLGRAHEAFASMGAAAFAGRARVELQAAGGRPRRRARETRHELTAQEREVAAGAASGATNREIATTMFISEATVAYHLRKVFQKLGVSSRRQLRDLELTAVAAGNQGGARG